MLNQTRFDIPDSFIIILGCTLRSKVTEEARQIVQAQVKDFQRIEGRSIDDHNADYESDSTWLNTHIIKIQQENRAMTNKSLKRRILVVTHHAPCKKETSNPSHVDNPWSSAFATDLLMDVETDQWAGIEAWIFGRTHFATESKKCGISVINNQRGYVLPGGMSSRENHGDPNKRCSI